MKVLVVQEFWENGTLRHRPGEVIVVSLEFYDLYRPFLKKLDQKRVVEK